MSNVTDTPETPAQEVASNYTPKSFDIAPEDRTAAERIANFHPTRDVPGAATIDGALKAPDRFSRSMLSPYLLERVNAELEALPVSARTVDAEQRIIRDVLEGNAYAYRVWGGAGDSANAYQREYFLIEQECAQTEHALSNLELRLAKTTGYVTVTDPDTGEVSNEPVFDVQGDARSAAEFEQADLRRRLVLLRGSEGERRKAEALWEATEAEKSQARRIDIERKAEARAQEIVANEEIEDRARAYAKFVRTER